jgi:hypothetical protein
MGEFERLVAEAEAKGYRLIRGLFDDASDNVYQIVALSKNPEAWEPYRAQRHLEESGSVALWWSFDNDLTCQNMAGEMIYAPQDPEDLEEDEEPQEANTEIFEPRDAADEADTFEELSQEDQEDVLGRIREVISGNITQRWDAPRSD